MFLRRLGRCIRILEDSTKLGNLGSAEVGTLSDGQQVFKTRQLQNCRAGAAKVRCTGPAKLIAENTSAQHHRRRRISREAGELCQC